MLVEYMADAGYEWYLENKRKYAERHLDDVVTVNKSKDLPQHILWAKSIAEKLIDEKSHYVGEGDTFGFNESLVNKLMYFAYLQGSKQINETSFQSGWNDCLSDIEKVFKPLADKLGYSNIEE